MPFSRGLNGIFRLRIVDHALPLDCGPNVSPRRKSEPMRNGIAESIRCVSQMET